MSSQPNPFVPGIAGETRSQAVARRLRGQLAERNITPSELARRLGVPQPKIQRRHAGKTPIQLDELDAIEKVTGISAEYLLTGVKKGGPPTGGGNRDNNPMMGKCHTSRPNHLRAVPDLTDTTTDCAA